MLLPHNTLEQSGYNLPSRHCETKPEAWTLTNRPMRERWSWFCLNSEPAPNRILIINYEGKSISNQPISFPIDRDGHDSHALFQYMFYM